MEAVNVAGFLGMEQPEPVSERERWANAVERLAMALSEGGYPTTVNRFSSRLGRENELMFHGRFPPRNVALRAAELCGVRDLMELAIVDAEGWM
ncbi:MAG: hypothetical protein LC750_07630 [Actinobacteria bacterium]|nr:hypothetical protein [Actinomycetota bacterium]